MSEMDIGAYRRAMQDLIIGALQNTDGSSDQITEYLRSKRVSGLLVRNKNEKRRALEDARLAFEKNSHWPVEIIISHLGVERSTIKDFI
ncbi:MAG TPA: hypothetical protein VLS48_06140 [Anaerolineales bacterium]|nr:hypothetical protein [Anaerolineales bacterium]